MDIFEAVQKGDINSLTAAIRDGANINEKNTAGNTALIEAAGNGHVDIVKMLIDKGANVHIENNNGVSALSVATNMGHSEIVNLLKEKTIPSTISRAIMIGYSSIGIGFINSLIGLEFTSKLSGTSIGYGIFNIIITLSFIFFIIYKISSGRNWARILYTICYFFYPLMWLSQTYRETIYKMFEALPFVGVLTVLIFILQTIILILLFQTQSSMWFKEKKLKK